MRDAKPLGDRGLGNENGGPGVFEHCGDSFERELRIDDAHVFRPLAEGDAAGLSSAVRDAVHEIDPTLSVFGVRTLEALPRVDIAYAYLDPRIRLGRGR